jgi:hypothetical protein
MPSESQSAPESDAKLQDLHGPDPDAPTVSRPRFYERPVVRAVLILVALLTMLGLLALFPSSHWRF